MSPATIKGEEKTIGRIFNGDYLFEIPGYQRPYAWTKDEAGQLLGDLLEASDDNEIDTSKLDPYFLGSIVLIKEDQPKSQIVDGQQRLITLIILLSVIRTLLPAKKAQDITKLIYEEENLLNKTPNRYRLKIKPQDAEFFEEYIQVEGGIERLKGISQNLSFSCNNIRENARHFYDVLKDYSEDRMWRLTEFIVHQCYSVVVSTPDLDSAYRIFSVLNDRGLELSLTDILKAEIIGKIKDSGKQDEYIKRWEDIEEHLDRDPFEKLFSHIQMIFEKRKPKKGSILEEIRDDVLPHYSPQDFIDKILKLRADAFWEIKKEALDSTSGADEINRLFGWLNKIDNIDWEPPAILYLENNRNNPDALERFFRDLERLAAGMMIIRYYRNDRIKRYGELLKAIEDEKDLYTDDSPLKLTDKEREDIIMVLNGNIYRIPNVPRYVLLRLNEEIAEGEVKVNYPIISIEHVLPQKPLEGSKWLEWWPDDEEREKNLHTLGNLVLLSRRKNSQAQNYDFDNKKDNYFRKDKIVSCPLTTQVIDEQEWTPEVVARRQAKLVGSLKRIWRL